ncbi:unnamed protein product [Urochloa decumbens]|uniref:LAGLIDADG homing endonuclease n=1 Tax=Urochloa decumbens TaxID=240449 RepID=A0ABC9BBY7_9POAL
MAPNGKRGWEPGQKGTRKKAKLQHVVSLGHSTNLNGRHVRQFMSLSNLVTKGKIAPQVTNDKAEIFDGNNSSHGIYLKEAEDLYHLWGCTKSKNLKIKFEILCVIEDSTTELNIKKPILAFSEGFGDGNEWGHVRTMLDELFGTTGDYLHTKPDHLVSFTRIGDKFQIRIFKIKNMPTLDENSMVLDELRPIFVIRPIEINHNDSTTLFLDKDMFRVSQVIYVSSLSEFDFLSIAVYLVLIF